MSTKGQPRNPRNVGVDRAVKTAAGSGNVHAFLSRFPKLMRVALGGGFILGAVLLACNFVAPGSQDFLKKINF